MRAFVYIIILAIVFLVFKAFYVDAYLEEKKVEEANVTKFTIPTKPVPILKTRGVYSGEQNVTIVKRKTPYSDMPLEQLGEKIGDKLGEKL